jgi:hypothetical protein
VPKRIDNLTENVVGPSIGCRCPPNATYELASSVRRTRRFSARKLRLGIELLSELLSQLQGRSIWIENPSRRDRTQGISKLEAQVLPTALDVDSPTIGIKFTANLG